VGCKECSKTRCRLILVATTDFRCVFGKSTDFGRVGTQTAHENAGQPDRIQESDTAPLQLIAGTSIGGAQIFEQRTNPGFALRHEPGGSLDADRHVETRTRSHRYRTGTLPMVLSPEREAGAQPVWRFQAWWLSQGPALVRVKACLSEILLGLLCPGAHDTARASFGTVRLEPPQACAGP